MSIFEYNAKLHEDTLREDIREEGRREGEERMSIENFNPSVATVYVALCWGFEF